MTHASADPDQAALRLPKWWAYAWWAVTGAFVGIGVVSLLTVGPFLLPIAALLGVTGILWSPLRNQSTITLVAGLAVAPMLLAWINREGPGTVCTATRNGTTCSDRWSPWPFVFVAVVLLAVSAILAVRTRGAERMSRPTGTESPVPPPAS